MIVAHEEVDTAITGHRTWTLYDGARELCRMLPDGRVVLAPDASLNTIIERCVAHAKNVEEWREQMSIKAYEVIVLQNEEIDNLHRLVSCAETEIAALKEELAMYTGKMQ